ncbi:MAG: hypothetical protein A2V66_08505 [Ignavibacteria bacterium RBG_13_36_8]|nr:MAG: hypothetical protein A2V66_08505 [Ignavibacteria bacterium RBG_13_36_8]
MRVLKYLMVCSIILIAISCSTITIQPTNFAWPIESVLLTDEKGSVDEPRFSISFNATQLFVYEFGDSANVASQELRIIRDTKGYYYVTAANFKNVFIFNSDDGALKLEKKLLVSEKGLLSPAMNQRNPYIELIDGENKYLLTNKGFERK